MSGFYTVMSKAKMLDLLHGTCDDTDINNINSSSLLATAIQRCYNNISLEDEFSSIKPILPFIWIKNDEEFVEELGEVFPINWRNDIILQVSAEVDEVMCIDKVVFSKFFYLTHSNLTSEDLASSTEEWINTIGEQCSWGIKESEDVVFVLIGCTKKDLTKFLILNQEFDVESEDQAELKEQFSEDFQHAEEILKSNSFGG